MIRVSVTAPELAAVRGQRRDPTLTPAERDRVEMILLSAAGWAPPAIAGHPGVLRRDRPRRAQGVPADRPVGQRGS